MTELSRAELHRLARFGAEARLQELRREEAAIRQTFPELFGGGKRSIAAAAEPAPAGVAARGTVRKRSYKMSAAQKKAVSERMRKYWAARRRQKEKPAAK
ncbi:MAG TPA: hypothetical protein VNE16_12145 [Vicinamibacterales bacterium]|nr:hypothetical protein [Vicinamibacterales bacterium]